MNYRSEGERLNDLRRGSRCSRVPAKKGKGSYRRREKHSAKTD